ncbi:MAG TPA: hypothetical protein VLO13_05585, partial [Halomonas sp.]|nr:hypothetical protein [Halomonas sp.]
KPDSTDDYHPMADVPDLPWVFWRQSATPTAQASTSQSAKTETDDSPLYEDGRDGQNGSEANDDGVIEVPWDEPAQAVNEPAQPVNGDTVPSGEQGSPYGLDKLRGMSMKQFKEQLAKHGITAESGSFKSVELLKFEGTATIIERRMMAFWQEFGSRRIPHAIYFVFGLQDGGNRSAKFKEQYAEAKLWVSNWIKENLPSE